jgi:hypothetical protein
MQPRDALDHAQAFETAVAVATGAEMVVRDLGSPDGFCGEE